jgi:hypothetical protein
MAPRTPTQRYRGAGGLIDLPAVKAMYVDACQRLTVLDAALCKIDVNRMTAWAER